MKKKILFFGFLTMILMGFGGCNRATDVEKDLLEKAATLHDASMKTEAAIAAQMEQVKAEKERLLSLSTADSAAQTLAQALEMVEKDFNFWKESVVEVPGHHHHDEAGHHDHAHGESVEMSAEDAFYLQTELKVTLEAIQSRMDSLLQAAKKF